MWHGLPNHADGCIHHPAHLQLHRRRQSGGGTDPGQRWKLLREHVNRRDYWRWNGLQNYSNRHVDDGAQPRSEEWRWRVPHGTGPALQRDFLRADRSWRQRVVPFLRRLVWHALQSVGSLRTDRFSFLARPFDVIKTSPASYQLQNTGDES